MALQSMTGFARCQGSDQTSSWFWELRSVNGKSLDLRFRLPGGLETIERELRDIAAKALARGNVQAALQLESEVGKALPVLNEQAFSAALEIAGRVSTITGQPAPSMESLLQIKGVIEYAEAAESEETLEQRQTALVKSFADAVDQLVAAREREGAAIASVLSDQIGEIGRLVDAIKADPSRSAEAIRARLAEQMARLVDEATSLDAQRLYQEAAILATKADLQEEIDRLESHVKLANELISSGGAIGRKLDFLAQEFNRECNTICSKSNAAAVTACGLEMKVVIDQFREQIQNLQ